MSFKTKVTICPGSTFRTICINGCDTYITASPAMANVNCGFFVDDVKLDGSFRRVFLTTKCDASQLNAFLHNEKPFTMNAFEWLCDSFQIEDSDNDKAEFSAKNDMKRFHNVSFTSNTTFQFEEPMYCWFVKNGKIEYIVRPGYYPFTLGFDRGNDKAIYELLINEGNEPYDGIVITILKNSIFYTKSGYFTSGQDIVIQTHKPIPIGGKLAIYCTDVNATISDVITDITMLQPMCPEYVFYPCHKNGDTRYDSPSRISISWNEIRNIYTNSKLYSQENVHITASNKCRFTDLSEGSTTEHLRSYWDSSLPTTRIDIRINTEKMRNYNWRIKSMCAKNYISSLLPSSRTCITASLFGACLTLGLIGAGNLFKKNPISHDVKIASEIALYASIICAGEVWLVSTALQNNY